jgi:hypothetical protein
MVLGILALGPFSILAGIPAITVGVPALSRGRPGRGMAIAGVVMGALSIVVMILTVAAVMLIRPKTSARPPINAERFVRNMEGRLQKLEDKVAQARADVPGAPAEQWQRISDDIASTRRLLGEMARVTVQKDLEAKAVEVNKAYIGARQTLKEITGKDASTDSAGR